MYANEDLDAAVEAGVLPSDAAEKFRAFTAKRSGKLPADEEHVRVSLGLADIFATVGLVLLFYAIWVGTRHMGPVSGWFYAGLAWPLAEFFVRARKMVLPGFLLLGALGVGSAFGLFALSLSLPGPVANPALPFRQYLDLVLSPERNIFVSGGVALLCWLYWCRFQVPIAVAAASLMLYNLPAMFEYIVSVETAVRLAGVTMLVSGLITFAAAMWWDMSDVHRQTRRSDVGFWLHLLAGSVIANVVFRYAMGIGVMPGEPFELLRRTMMTLSAGQAVLMLAIYAGFMIVSLIVDRRALMLSSLMFGFAAFATLSGADHGSGPVLFGAVAMSAVVLAAAVFWRPLRHAVIGCLPLVVRAQLPRTQVQRPRARPLP